MSRIGKVPVVIPQGVNVTVAQNEIAVKGPKGELKWVYPSRMNVTVQDNAVHVTRSADDKQSRAYHGLTQRLIANMVQGVSKGFSKELEVQGVGYTVTAAGNKLSLKLGFSHPIELEPPAGIKYEVPKANTIIVSGCDKQLVGEMAAKIRGLRPPEPYKGKGIRYTGEQVRRKEGKKAGK
ncbi:50S ribosomal protein L6 [Candidatus Sumerlaeota bacterium]|nr:50S ribosomal protein L6 [Candidatus Sumerlaeota bacterium]